MQTSSAAHVPLTPAHLVYIWLPDEDEYVDLLAEGLTLEDAVRRGDNGDPRLKDLSVAVVTHCDADTVTAQSLRDFEVYGDIDISQVIPLSVNDILELFGA